MMVRKYTDRMIALVPGRAHNNPTDISYVLFNDITGKLPE